MCICLFVWNVLVFCHFSLPLGVGGWLLFVTVVFPGLFCYFFLIVSKPKCQLRALPG